MELLNITEQWKAIDGYEGLYEVCTNGRIKRLKGQVRRKGGGLYKVNEKILNTSSTNMGYPVVNLSKDGNLKQFKVHRLVAETFISNPFNKSVVNHIDNDKTNNSVSNLEWTTISENTQHAIDLLKIEEIEIVNNNRMNEDELWKEIDNFGGTYLVSTHGRIQERKSGTILDDYVKVNGNRKVYLKYDEKSSYYFVHRLVAEAFIKNENNKLIVYHRDGNKDNNIVWNLIWLTSSELHDKKFTPSHNREEILNIPRNDDNEEEMWKDILNFEGFYEVSNVGRVRSKNRIIEDSLGRKRKYTSRILSVRSKNGYCFVSLNKGNTSKDIAVHRLVAEAFTPNPNDKPYINHINSNRADNSVENLEWSTPKENMEHMSEMDRGYVRSIQKYNLTGDLIDEYPSIIKACAINDLDYRSLIAALNKNNSSCGGYQWKYTDDEKVIVTYEPANNVKVNQYELNGEYIQTFPSIQVAVNYLNQNGYPNACGGNISRACNGEAKYAYNFQWRDVHNNKPVTAMNPAIRRVVQLTIDGEYIDQFESIREAEIANNIKLNTSSIGKCCRGKLKRANGYKWMYEEDYIKNCSTD